MNTYIIRVGAASDTPLKNCDKIGGFPTYMPPKVPVVNSASGHFLMEIYNHGFADEDIICWQIYQGEKGGTVSDVIEIRKGAQLYDENSKLLRKRRWLNEYPIILEACEEDQADENISRIGGAIPKVAVKDLKRKKIVYFATLVKDLCPNDELGAGESDIVLGFDKNGKLGGWCFDED